MRAIAVLITRAEVGGGPVLDVRTAGEKIAEMAPSLSREKGEPVIDAAGGALVPGLHDHHLHLFAMAAASTSVRCGPPDVRDEETLARAISAATPETDWIRGIGYFESVAGRLGRVQLDRMAPDRPLRIQHRSGSLWMLNSAGIERLGLDRGADAPGVERDAAGRATGRLFHLDAWLRERLGREDTPSLHAVGLRLAQLGVTGVTDASAGNGPADLGALVAAADRGELVQRVVVMGAPGLPDLMHRSVIRGAVKVRLAEDDLPGFESLVELVERTHQEGRSTAFHCVTRTELVLAVAVLEAAGPCPEDRIEHAAVAPPDVMPLLARLGVCVVCNPGFVRERGDDYLAGVDATDLPWLHRCGAFDAAGIPLGAGTDAPFGDVDPWRAMRAAVDRRTGTGAPLGPAEGVTPERALALFTSPAKAPGAAPRRIVPGATADLCLLDRPWRDARDRLSADDVAATFVGGSAVWQRG